MKRIKTGSGESYKILTGLDICTDPMSPQTKQYIDDLMVIDAECYGSEDKGEDCAYVGTADGYYNRFGYKPDEKGVLRLDPNAGCCDNIIAVANSDGHIVGYINYLTLGDELHNEIINPDIEEYLKDPEEGSSKRDDGITGDQLVQWSRKNPNNLFILSVTIAKKYQDGEVVKLVSNEFLEELRTKEENGYHIGSISGDTVSDHGEDFAKMLRCDTVDKDGKPLILPSPDSDESGHDVTVRVCEGENLEKLLQDGFDFSREKLVAPTKKSQRGKEFDFGTDDTEFIDEKE